MRAPSSKAPSQSKSYGDGKNVRKTADSALMQNLGLDISPGKVNPNSGLLQLLLSRTPVRKQYRR